MSQLLRYGRTPDFAVALKRTSARVATLLTNVLSRCLALQLVKKDPVAAGLCGIQLFHMSLVQDEAVRHLGQAKASDVT